MLDTSRIIEWHRVQAYQDVSLKLILQEVLRELVLERANDEMFLQREIVLEPLRPLPTLADDEFHLYVSDHNVEVSSFMTLLNEYRTPRAIRSTQR